MPGCQQSTLDRVTNNVLVLSLPYTVTPNNSKQVDTKVTRKEIKFSPKFTLYSSMSCRTGKQNPALIRCSTNCIISLMVLQGEAKHKEKGECCLCCLFAGFGSHSHLEPLVCGSCPSFPTWVIRCTVLLSPKHTKQAVKSVRRTGVKRAAVMASKSETYILNAAWVWAAQI